MMNADDMLMATAKDIDIYGHKLDSRDGGCKEIVGHHLGINDGTKCVVMNRSRNLSPSYAAAEALWYFSKNRDVKMLLKYAPSYSRFTNDGLAMGAYGYRWIANPGWAGNEDVSSGSQLEGVIDLLKAKPGTRQAVVTMWDSEDLAHAILGDWKDIPCTIAMQFMARNDHLHAVTYMRSNDVWLGLPNDLFAFGVVQIVVGCELELSIGHYSHHVGSMHMYDRDAEKMSRLLSKDSSMSNPDNLGLARFGATLLNMEAAVAAEREIRTAVDDDQSSMPSWGTVHNIAINHHLYRGLARDLYMMCAAHCLGRWDLDLSLIASPALVELVRRKHAAD